MTIVAPKWYAEPRPVTLKFDADRAKTDPVGGDVVVYFTAGTADSALVPAHAVDFEASTVKAAEVGEFGDSVIVSFSPTSSGTSSFSVSRKVLDTQLKV